MAYCKNCGAHIPDDAGFCGECGTPVSGGAGMPRYTDIYDHTAEFDSEDISSNKVVAMAAYILGMVGIVIALLAAPNSKYAAFHSRQALKLSITNTLLAFVMVLLSWTIIVPIAGAVCIVILGVVRIICFFQVCSGKAKELPLIGTFRILK
mgnify:CR=1 FL=1